MAIRPPVQMPTNGREFTRWCQETQANSPWGFPKYTVAQLADIPAENWEGCGVYVTDETGGKTIAFSDGTDWRRAQDRAIVS